MNRAGEGPQGAPPRGVWRAALPLYILPVVILGGLFVSVQYAPDGIEDFYVDSALPFLIAVWIGAGFNVAWTIVNESMLRDRAPAGLVAAVGILGALVLLSMLGGFRLLWEDPWLFGVAVWPGFAMARPLIGRWLFGSPEAAAVESTSGSRAPE